MSTLTNGWTDNDRQRNHRKTYTGHIYFQYIRVSIRFCMYRWYGHMNHWICSYGIAPYSPHHNSIFRMLKEIMNNLQNLSQIEIYYFDYIGFFLHVSCMDF